MSNTKMNSMDWDDIRFFLAAARNGSLTGASHSIGSNQPTVGRRIDALEAALGTRLFQRHAQGLTLTDEGRRVLHIAETMEDAARKFNRAQEKENEIRGKIGLALPEGLSAHVVAPRLPGLLERYPRLEISLLPSSASADLVHGEADVAVRLFQPTENDLFVRKVGEMKFGIYGSKTYFERHGNPRAKTELLQHQFIGYGERLRHSEENRWLEVAAGAGRFPLRSDDTHTRLAAAVAGLGLTVLPHFLGEKTQLLAVAMSTSIPSRPIWLVVHRDLRNLARVRVTINWLVEQLREAFPET